MTAILYGRGGWANRTLVSISRLAVIALLCATVAVTGCSSKKKPKAGEGAGGSHLGEQGMGAAGGSMGEFQRGTLGSENGGPLQDIHFDLDEFTIRPQDGELLRANAKWLNDHPDNHVQVEGHCDERGSEQYNIALGAKRAQAAKEYLNTLGISDDRISTISYGKELQLCNEHNESCWAENRRDHFVVSGK